MHTKVMTSRRDCLGLLAASGASLAFAGTASGQGGRVSLFVVSSLDTPLASSEDLEGRRLCMSARAEDFQDLIQKTGASLARVPSHEAPIAFSKGFCDGIVFAGDDRERLVRAADILFGGADAYASFFMN